MAIRTISIFQGHYLALQGGGMWDELSGFSLLEVLTRSHRSDHSISDPTTVSPRQAHVPPSALIFPDRRMSGICLDGMTIFDEEEDDQHSSSLDGLLWKLIHLCVSSLLMIYMDLGSLDCGQKTAVHLSRVWV